MKTRIVNVAVVAVIAGLLLGYVAGYFGANTASLTQRISTLENQVDELNSQLNSTNSQIVQLQSQVTEKGTRINSLESQLINLSQQLSRLQTEKTSLSQQNDYLETIITQLESQIQTQILGVYFSPNGGCQNQVAYWINRANSSIHVLIYSFTLDSIGDDLVEAHQRNVDVKVVFEKQQITQYSEYQKLKAANVQVRNDTNPDYMHDKIMIIDDTIVLTGSFNYSAAAEEDNNENLIVIKSIGIASIYEREFQKIWNQSI